jgi:hypothetical protein
MAAKPVFCSILIGSGLWARAVRSRSILVRRAGTKKQNISRKGAKHVLSDVEGAAKAGYGIKWIFFTGDNGDELKKLRFLCSLLLEEVTWRLGARIILSAPN